MKLTPRTPRRVVRRFIWALIEGGGKISYQLGGEPLLRRFIYSLPKNSIRNLARAELADRAADPA